VEQELLTLFEQLKSLPLFVGFVWFNVSFLYSVMWIIVCLMLSIFVLRIALYVLRQFTVFAIFKHFLVNGNDLKKLIVYSLVIYFVIVNLDGITFFYPHS